MNCRFKSTISIKQNLAFNWPVQISFNGALQVLGYFLPLILLFLPHMVFAADGAASSLTFKPHTGDQSVIFLGNIFGVVDGVLAGTGSQIAGQMFGVFNTAILSLGGILITYTLLVSTLNTAQEGQFLGQKWSSIWVPMRSIAGISLLLPKASGYCVLQIFVMWVVLQGIGAADKVWSQALSYLNRGGTIVKPNVDPITSMKNADSGEILNGAYGILTAQVCMVALQQSLEKYQTTLKNDSDSSSTCNIAKARDSAERKNTNLFCTTSVPSFINSVDFTSDTLVPIGGLYKVDMPNIDEDVDPYNKFNGMCGSVQFKPFSIGGETKSKELGLNSAQAKTLNKSRNIAMSQMYDYLAGVATKIVNNAQQFNPSITCVPESDCLASAEAQYVAQYALGTPVTLNLEQCTAALNPYKEGGDEYKSDACLSWDLLGGATNSVLLRGNEIKDAVSTYNGMMSASLYIKSQAGNAADYRKIRQFIAKADQEGWILAGAYYFRLAILTSQVLQKSSSAGADTDSDLAVCAPFNPGSCGAGQWNYAGIKNAFIDDDKCGFWKREGIAMGDLLCLSGNTESLSSAQRHLKNSITALQSIIGPATDSIPVLKVGTIVAPVYNFEANTVFGYLKNGTALVVPGQPGSKQPVFTMKLDFNTSSGIPNMGNQNINAGLWNIPGSVITFIFNNVLKHIFNFVIALIVPIVNQLFFAIIMPPLVLLASVFQGAIEVMQNVNVNPILALANMGVKFIEGSSNAGILIMAAGVGAAAIGLPAITLLMMLLPLIGIWLGIMLTVGMMAAFYIPLIPFFIFLFASIGWLIGVIEAMVAAPLVALGVMNPEGDQAFGKGDQAIMLILGIFLRPAMMIMGYIFGIILSYVGIWFVNAGFAIVIPQIENMPAIDTSTGGMDDALGVTSKIGGVIGGAVAGGAVGGPVGAIAGAGAGASGVSNNSIYGMWSTIFLYFFLLLTYISSLIAVVNQAFEMIYYLPDKVLRWLSGGGGAGEIGSGANVANSGMQQMKQEHKSAAGKSSSAVAQMTGKAIAAIPGKPKKKGGAKSEAKGGDAKKTDDKNDAEISGGDDDTEISGGDADSTEISGGSDSDDTEISGGGSASPPTPPPLPPGPKSKSGPKFAAMSLNTPGDSKVEDNSENMSSLLDAAKDLGSTLDDLSDSD